MVVGEMDMKLVQHQQQEQEEVDQDLGYMDYQLIIIIMEKKC